MRIEELIKKCKNNNFDCGIKSIEMQPLNEFIIDRTIINKLNGNNLLYIFCDEPYHEILTYDKEKEKIFDCSREIKKIEYDSLNVIGYRIVEKPQYTLKDYINNIKEYGCFNKFFIHEIYLDYNPDTKVYALVNKCGEVLLLDDTGGKIEDDDNYFRMNVTSIKIHNK